MVRDTEHLRSVITIAEFCLNCWNKINGTNNPASKYIISKDLDLSEGCATYTNVIIKERKSCFLSPSEWTVFCGHRLHEIILVLVKILLLPYLVYKHHKRGK